jgi:3-(3-hydroxy-phenyl)propionate hydroxylase
MAAVLNEPPVLIVGAGPTGLAAAMCLARARVPVRLVERALQPASHSRAIGIQARTLELLEQHRVVEQFLAAGHRLRAVNLYSAGHRLARLDFDPLRTRYPFLLCLGQSVAERILSDHLAAFGVVVERGVELVDLVQADSQVHAGLRHSDGRHETIQASFIVAADGAHSTVRHLLDLKSSGKAFDQTLMLADLCADSDLSDDEVHMFTSKDGIAALVPMGGGRHRFLADHASDGALPEESAAEVRDVYTPTLERLQAAARRRIDRRLELSKLEWSSCFRLHSGVVERLRVQRAFLAGDAAYVHSPAGGEDMDAGIQEAFNLGWKLARVRSGDAPEALLDTYQAERQPIERRVLRQVSLVTQLAEAGRGPLKLLRERGTPVLASFGPLRDAARLTVSELSIQYRRSPLTLERVLDGGPRAGERAPDALVQVVDGPLGRAPGTGYIYDLHDPACFSLFVLIAWPHDGKERSRAASAVSPEAMGVWTDVDRLATVLSAKLASDVRIWRVTDMACRRGPSLTEAYGRTRPAFYMLRPDGYICARGRPASDAGALVRHCETWFAMRRDR